MLQNWNFGKSQVESGAAQWHWFFLKCSVWNGMNLLSNWGRHSNWKEIRSFKFIKWACCWDIHNVGFLSHNIVECIGFFFTRVLLCSCMTWFDLTHDLIERIFFLESFAHSTKPVEMLRGLWSTQYWYYFSTMMEGKPNKHPKTNELPSCFNLQLMRYSYSVHYIGCVEYLSSKHTHHSNRRPKQNQIKKSDGYHCQKRQTPLTPLIN